MTACGDGSGRVETPPADAGPVEALPCDVQAAIKEACGQCHFRPLAHGAPLALETFEDTRQPWTQPPTYDGTPTWKVMGESIEANWMPQPWPGVVLTAATRQVILSWVAREAPAAPAGTICK